MGLERALPAPGPTGAPASTPSPAPDTAAGGARPGSAAIPTLGVEKLVSSKVVTTTLGWLLRWARKNSLWPMPFGTACCAIEMMATLSGRYDLARFGAEVLRFSPRQSDLMIVSGRVCIKMMPVLIKIYRQMPEPKWVISMGACASSGGVFDTYTMIQGVDQFIPVDVYIPGCPPRPESLIDAVIKVQEIIDRGHPGYLPEEIKLPADFLAKAGVPPQGAELQRSRERR